MAVDTTRAKVIAERLKKQTRNTDLLDLCDYVLQGPQVGPPMVRDTRLKVQPASLLPGGITYVSCPVCAARRQAKALAMRKWRSKS